MTKLSILVAEDDPSDVFLMQRAFKQADFKAPVRFVGDGQEAIDYLQGESPFSNRISNPMPTLVLLDIKMPRLDGFDVIKWVRHQESLRRLPILVLTSSNEDRDVNRAYDLGANSYLVKPFGLHDLVRLALDIQNYWLSRNRSPAFEV